MGSDRQPDKTTLAAAAAVVDVNTKKRKGEA